MSENAIKQWQVQATINKQAAGVRGLLQQFLFPSMIRRVVSACIRLFKRAVELAYDVKHFPALMVTSSISCTTVRDARGKVPSAAAHPSQACFSVVHSLLLPSNPPFQYSSFLLNAFPVFFFSPEKYIRLSDPKHQ